MTNEEKLKQQFPWIMNCLGPTTAYTAWILKYCPPRVEYPWFREYIDAPFILKVEAREALFVKADTPRFNFCIIIEVNYKRLSDTEREAWDSSLYGIRLSESRRMLRENLEGLVIGVEEAKFFKRFKILLSAFHSEERAELARVNPVVFPVDEGATRKMDLGHGYNTGSPLTSGSSTVKFASSFEDLLLWCMSAKHNGSPDAKALRIAATLVCQLYPKSEIEIATGLSFSMYPQLGEMYRRLHQL